MPRILLGKGHPPTSVEGKTGKEYILIPGQPCKVDGDDLAHIRQKYPALKLTELKGKAGQKKNDPVKPSASKAVLTASEESTSANETATVESSEPETSAEDSTDDSDAVGEDGEDGEDDGVDPEPEEDSNGSTRKKKKRKRY